MAKEIVPRNSTTMAATAISKLCENAWSEFIPFLDYDVEIRGVI
jgi:hypothetical protein